MMLSRERKEDQKRGGGESFFIDLGPASYRIQLERGSLSHLNDFMGLKGRKVMLVTDKGVPEDYVKEAAAQADQPFIHRVDEGEGSKSLAVYGGLLSHLLEEGFSRTDAVLAVGGGVVGDLAGFAASTYMRGIDFYNLPTTLLSQIDSSIGGKTAVNLDGVKNIAGSFYQPKAVVVDPNTLKTLEDRQLRNGLAEAIKMAACLDGGLFRQLEENDPLSIVDRVIAGCIQLKRAVVEADEKEGGLRRVLNFGHTVGHAVEAAGGLLHGEAVAVGMTYFAGPGARARLLSLLQREGLPTATDLLPAQLYSRLVHDKKVEEDQIFLVLLPEIGHFELRELPLDVLMPVLKRRSAYLEDGRLLWEGREG